MANSLNDDDAPPTAEPAFRPSAKLSVSAALMAAAGGARTVTPDFARIKAELDAASPHAAMIAKELARSRLEAQLADDVEKARRMVEANPNAVTAQFGLARALRENGDFNGAIAAFRRCLALDPNAIAAKYFLSALGAEDVPPQAPPPLVAGLFDFYSARFEIDLVQNLKYQGPRLLLDAVQAVIGQPARGLDVVDIGCGTGLCGALFRPLARRLDGIDLSPGMLALAHAKGIYTSLAQGEIAATLATTIAAYDLVIAGDVVIYIGDLAPSLAAISGALRTGGLFAFTTEKTAGQGFTLVSTGHYRHSPAYIAAEASRAGLAIRRAVDCVIRFEKGDALLGETYVLAKL